MGGTLRVDSLPGQGSTFDFVVECQAAAPARPADAAAAPALPGLACLVVDDNPSARLVLTEMAASFGWRVDSVADGYAALGAVAERGAERPYDVIIVDWRMPMLDGWETSKRIRGMATDGKMPLIIMVTGHDREVLAQRQERLAEVLDGILIKPVTASMLLDVVADARQGRRQLELAIPAPSALPLAGLRLLLVEDNPSNQQVASELLSNEGAALDVCGGGQAAIDLLRRGGPAPDLILMDIQMPDMDGYSATRAIHALLGSGAPPIVAMTANAMAADRAAALAAGMVDHVGKPFELALLIDVILRHVRRDGAAPASRPVPAEEPAAAGTPGTAKAILDSAPALARLGGNAGVYLLALDTFVAEARRHAGQLSAAKAEQQTGVALPLLHTLKGLAGTVGAERLSSLAHQAEQAMHAGAQEGAGWDEVIAVVAACPPAVDAVERRAAELRATPWGQVSK